MAIIYTYPIKATPIDTDLVLITDSESEDPADATKQVSIASIKGAGSGPGSGTQYTLPMWGTISTLADSMVKQNAAANELTLASGASDKIIIPEYIHHLSDANSYFGFPIDDGWKLVTGGLDKIGVVGSRAILYHTSTIAEPKLETTSSGIKIVGSTSELGGKIQFNSANGTTNVALAGPANSGTSYTLRFPSAIGGNGQILALPASFTGVDETLVWKDESTVGSGAEGRVAYWTTSADPGLLGNAPIKYTPASAGPPIVNELTEIISNSVTHDIKIGTEANAGLVHIGGTNAGTIVRSGSTTQINSGDSDAVTISGGILTAIHTSSRSGHINLINYNTNPSSGLITSSINIGNVNGSSGWLADSINMFKNVNIANVVTFSTLVGASFALNKKIQLTRNDSNVGGGSASLFIDSTTTNAAGTSNIWTAVSTQGAQKSISFAYNTTEVGFIRPVSSSAIEIGGYTSDERLKTDIVDWDDKVLDKFKAINPKKYKYTKDKELGIEKEFKGFIAQDMQGKFPEAYKKDLPTEEGGLEYYYFDPIAMITPLMKAIKELNEKIEVLESK
tara:strand:+ start:626 stop:2317 length:1692 start_codon:yes stop_codon:yes gene_type:complete